MFFKGNDKDKVQEIKEALRRISSAGVVGIDTETTGLDFLVNDIILFQIADEGKECLVIDVRECLKETKDAINEVMSNDKILKIGHNIKHDYQFLKKMGVDTENVYDTMLSEMVLYAGLRPPKGFYSLKELLSRYLGIELEKGEQLTFIDFTGEVTESQIEYSAQDVLHLVALMKKQKERLKKTVYRGIEIEGLHKTAMLENKVLPAFADMEMNGIHVDVEALKANGEYSKKVMRESHKQLDIAMLSSKEMCKNLYKLGTLTFSSDTEVYKGIGVNWVSPVQAKVLIESIIPGIKSVNAKTLNTHRNQPFIKQFLKFKKQQKLNSTYGDSLLAKVRDGKIYTQFFQILATGRVSSGNKNMGRPNMQNIPKDNHYRNCYIAPEGWLWNRGDYSNQELRIAAELSGEPAFMRAFREGKDLHSVVGAMMFKKTEDEIWNDKTLRDKVKTVNFQKLYGGSPYAVAMSLDIPVEEAEEIDRLYRKELPILTSYLERSMKEVSSRGYTRTMSPVNRVRWYYQYHEVKNTLSYLYRRYGKSTFKKGEEGFELYNKTLKLDSSQQREGVNSPIQGTGADMMKVAMVYVRDYINKHKFPAVIRLQVHDELNENVKPEYAEDWADIKRKLMIKAGEIFLKKVPVEVDIQTTDKWTK